MATANQTIGANWFKVADNTDYLLIQPKGRIEFALTDADSAPVGISGYDANQESALIRSADSANVPPGYVWVRSNDYLISSGDTPEDVLIAYEVWV